MLRRRFRLSHRPLMVGAVFALAAAALLVVYLQQHSSAYERRQTALIIQQACERTAMALGAEVRRLFDGAVIDVIGGLGHPELEEPKLPALATLFNAAHNRFPYVHRFFMWNADTAKRFPDQVLIYEPDVARAPPQDRIFWIDGRPIGALLQDPVLKNKGYAEGATVLIGHFIGMDNHEGGRITEEGTKGVILEPGMVISWHPNVVVPGEGGVRTICSDTILVTEKGAEMMSKLPMEPIVYL